MYVPRGHPGHRDPLLHLTLRPVASFGDVGVLASRISLLMVGCVGKAVACGRSCPAWSPIYSSPIEPRTRTRTRLCDLSPPRQESVDQAGQSPLTAAPEGTHTQQVHLNTAAACREAGFDFVPMVADLVGRFSLLRKTMGMSLGVSLAHGPRSPRALASKQRTSTRSCSRVQRRTFAWLTHERRSTGLMCRFSDFVTPSSANPGGTLPESAVPVRRERMLRSKNTKKHIVPRCLCSPGGARRALGGGRGSTSQQLRAVRIIV